MNRLKLSTIVLIFLCAALILTVCARFLPEGQTASADEFMWYYLPHAQNEPPDPMEKAAYIADYDVLYLGDTSKKVIYLTFDDCPNNGNIPKILDVLEAHGATAAFFMNEAYIRSHPDVICRIAEGRSIVGNHTAHHIGLSRVSFEKFKAELEGVEDAYRDATGEELPKYFRPPQGLFSEKTLSFAQELGYTTVFWSFRYTDWDLHNQPSDDQAFRTIMDETHPGEIALLHAQSPVNLRVLDRVLTAWEEAGYQFGSLSEIPRVAEINSPDED